LRNPGHIGIACPGTVLNIYLQEKKREKKKKKEKRKLGLRRRGEERRGYMYICMYVWVY